MLFFSKAVVTWTFASTSWQQESSAQECLGENTRIMGISQKEARAKGHQIVGNVVFIIFILCNCFMIPHCELDDLDTCTSFGMKEIVIFIYVL